MCCIAPMIGMQTQFSPPAQGGITVLLPLKLASQFSTSWRYCCCCRNRCECYRSRCQSRTAGRCTGRCRLDNFIELPAYIDIYTAIYTGSVMLLQHVALGLAMLLLSVLLLLLLLLLSLLQLLLSLLQLQRLRYAD